MVILLKSEKELFFLSTILFSAFCDPTFEILIDKKYVVAAMGVGFYGHPLLY